MIKSDDNVSGILGVSPLNRERERATRKGKFLKAYSEKPGHDSVDISSRARRLADIENFLAEDENQEGESSKDQIKE